MMLKQKIIDVSPNYNRIATNAPETSHASIFKRLSAIVYPNVNNSKVSQDLTQKIKTSSTAVVKPKSFTAPINEQPKTPNGVPVVVEACLQYFNSKAMDCEGLFRVPGNQRLVDELWDYMQNHPYAALSTKSISIFMRNHPEFTANEVSSFLKRFIGSITSEPVVTYVCYRPLLDLIENKCPAHLIAGRFKHVIKLLVPAHRALLRRLCNFLFDFSQHVHESRMSIGAIAVCFGFLIRTPPSIESETSNSRIRRMCSVVCGRLSNQRTGTRARTMTAQEQTEYLMAQARASKLHVSVIEAMIRHSQSIFS